MVEDGALRRIVDTARATAGVVAVYLFGSQADGSAGIASDVDLAVLGECPLAFAALVDLQLRFADELTTRVDLIDLRTADAFLALDIIRGERLFCRDAALTDTYELFVMRRAGDLEPFERERRRVIMGTPLTTRAPRSEQ
jgi:predicted nucleotidyltransferase